MNQLIVVFLPLSDCHFVMKVFAKNNAFSRGSFVHRSHVFKSGEDRGKGGQPRSQDVFPLKVFKEKSPGNEVRGGGSGPRALP